VQKLSFLRTLSRNIMPSRWSISCWKTRAWKSFFRLSVISLPVRSKPVTMQERERGTNPRKSTDKSPSQSSLTSSERLLIFGLTTIVRGKYFFPTYHHEYFR